MKPLMTKAPPGSYHRYGFTLLEIMVAMVVLTLIVTTAFGALRLGERSWESGLVHSAKTENLRTVSGVLKRLVNQAIPLSWKQNTKTILAFDGAAETLRFIGPSPQHQGATGLFEYTLALEPHAGAYRLMMYYRVHNPDIAGFAEQGSESEHVELATDLESSNFRYFGSPDDKSPPEWHSQWNNDAEGFPLMVHAELRARAQRDQWPDLYLAFNSVDDQ